MQSFRKQMALLLVFMFMFTQTMPLGALAANSNSDPNNTKMGNTAPSFTNNSYQSALGTGDSLSNYYLKQYKDSLGWDWLKTTNVSFTAFSGNTPQWNINTFQPLTLKDKLDNFLFVQGQYGTGNNTVNAGLGYRTMNAAHSSMYGVNVFYDWQATVQGESGYNPSGSHMRLGAGLEYYTGPLEARVNGYYGISPDVQVGAVNATTGISAWQTVAPGLDLSVGSDFSFWNAPWLKLTATGSWYHQQNGGTINGYNGSPLYANITAALQVTPQLQLTAGGTMGNGTPSNGNFGFQFNLLAPPQPALFLADPVINNGAAKDISYKILQPVQRNNTITVERYTKQSGGSSENISITVNDSEGNPVPGSVVTITQLATTAATTASEAGYTAITNSSGMVDFSNLPAGSYGYTAQMGQAQQTGAVTSKTQIVSMPAYGVMVLTGAAVQELTDGTLTLYDQYGNAVDFSYDLSNSVYRSDGNIVLRGLAQGQTYTMNINHDGIDDVIAPTTPASASPNVNNAAAATVSSSEITPPSAVKGAIMAQVFYKGSSVPEPGITVTLTPAAGGTAQSLTTDANGFASFKNLDYATYSISFSDTSITGEDITIRAEKRGYSNKYYSQTAAPKTGTLTISSIVYNDGSALNDGATVIITDSNGIYKYKAAYSASAGVKFAGIAQGTYAVTANIPGTDGAAVATNPSVITISDSEPAVTATGTIDQSKPAVGTAVITATANGAAVTAGTYLYIDSINTSKVISGSNSITVNNLTKGTHYFALGATNVSGAAVPGSYWVMAAEITDGGTTNVALAGQYTPVSITTLNADGSAAANTAVTVKPYISDAFGTGSSEVSFTVTTGTDGKATVNLWKKSLDEDGFGKYTMSATIQGNALTKVADTAASDPSVTLQPVTANASISGKITVTGSSSIAIYGASVTLNGESGSSTTTSATDGTYSFTGVAAGTYSMEVTKHGYKPAMTVEFTVESGQALTNNIELVATGEDKVTIYTTVPTALAAASLAALSVRNSTDEIKYFSGGNSVTFTELPGQVVTYFVMMRGDDGVTLAENMGQTSYETRDGQHETNVEIAAGGLKITGFYWQDGTALTQTELDSYSAAVRYDSKSFHTARLSDLVLSTGYLLAGGTYSLKLEDGTEIYTTKTGGSDITVSNGAMTETALYIQKAITGNISGTVYGINGTTPVSGATVTAGSAGATTAQDGTYTLSGLAAGSYAVIATYGSLVGSKSGVEVQAGQTTTGVNITLVQPKGGIYGQVKDTQGVAVANITVQLKDENGGAIAEMKTNDEGWYAFASLDFGNYIVQCADASESVYVTTDNPEVRQDLTVKNSGVQLVLTGLMTVAPGSRIDIYRDGSSTVYKTCEVSGNGTINVSLEAGTYTFKAVVQTYTATFDPTVVTITSGYGDVELVQVKFTR